MEVIKVGPRAPNLNAHAERWVLSIKSECLDHFVVFGEDHLRYLLTEYVDHFYNQVRPHQGVDIGNVPLAALPPSTGDPPPLTSLAEVICHQRLGGLLKHYERKAA